MSEDNATLDSQAKLPRRRSPWVSVLLYALVFGSGAVCGAGLTIVAINKHVRRVVHHPELAAKGFMRVMARRLDLDDAQKKAIREILGKRHAGLQRLRTKYQPQVEAQLGQLVEEIEQVLRPDQKQEFRAIVARMHELKPPLPDGARDEPAAAPNGSAL